MSENRFTDQINANYRQQQAMVQPQFYGSNATPEARAVLEERALALQEGQRPSAFERISLYGNQAAVPATQSSALARMPERGLAVPDQQAAVSVEQKNPRRRKMIAIVATTAVALGGGGAALAFNKMHHAEEVDPAVGAAAAIRTAELTPPSKTASLIPGCMEVASISLVGSGLVNVPVTTYTKSAKPTPVKDVITQASTFMSIKGGIELCDPDPTAKDKKPLTEYKNGKYIVNRGVLTTSFELDPNDPVNCTNISLDREVGKQYDCVQPPMTTVYVNKMAVDGKEFVSKYAFTDKDKKVYADLQNPDSAGYDTYRTAMLKKFQYLGLSALNGKDAHAALQQSIDKSLEQYILSQMDSTAVRKRVVGHFEFEGDYGMPDKQYKADNKKQLDYKLADVKDYVPTITVKPVVAQPQTGA